MENSGKALFSTFYVSPDWHSSAVAELYTPPVFENDKKSGGYFRKIICIFAA